VKRAFESETVIDRPVPEVWGVLTDWANAPRWMPGVDTMTCDAGTTVGATITFHTRGRARISTVSAAEPPRSVTLDSVQGGVTARYRYHLEPAGDRTTARLTADVAAAGLWAPLGPVVRAAIRRSDAGQLDALRALVERRPG
jgi:carbon monoxide dehydrogenase subunit G